MGTQGKRLARVRIDGEYLLALLTKGEEGVFRCVEGIPKDATVISSHFDISRQCVYLVISHPDLPLIRQGAEITELRITLEYTPDYRKHPWAWPIFDSVISADDVMARVRELRDAAAKLAEGDSYPTFKTEFTVCGESIGESK